jgi:hypothetical protein
VKYKQGIYMPEDDIPHSHRRENLKSYKCPSKFEIRCDGAELLASQTLASTTELMGLQR